MWLFLICSQFPEIFPFLLQHSLEPFIIKYHRLESRTFLYLLGQLELDALVVLYDGSDFGEGLVVVLEAELVFLVEIV